MAKIQIYGKTYNLKSSSTEVSLEEAATYVDSKMRELGEARKKTPSLDLAVLAALNIAQELLELQSQTKANDQTQDEKIARLLEALEGELQAIDN